VYEDSGKTILVQSGLNRCFRLDRDKMCPEGRSQNYSATKNWLENCGKLVMDLNSLAVYYDTSVKVFG